MCPPFRRSNIAYKDSRNGLSYTLPKHKLKVTPNETQRKRGAGFPRTGEGTRGGADRVESKDNLFLLSLSKCIFSSLPLHSLTTPGLIFLQNIQDWRSDLREASFFGTFFDIFDIS